MSATQSLRRRARWVLSEGRALLFFTLPIFSAGWATAPVGYLYRQIGGAAYHVVVVDLHDPRVKVSPLLTVRYPGGAEPASSLIRRYWPVAAITGTYFCTISLRPVGDIVIDGRLRHFGGMGRAVALTPRNEATFISVPFGRHVDWRGFESVLAAGPTLIRNGRVSVTPRSEGFSDPDVLGLARRCAVGLTWAGKLLLVSTNHAVSLSELARALRQLGCVEAVNLDGGSSACLWYRGRYLVRPSRRLVNMLAVFDDVDPCTRAAHKPGPVLLAWRAKRAAELYRRAIADRRRAVDLLARACELDASNASYATALAETLARQGDLLAASGAYVEAGRRYLSKHLIDQALDCARRASELSPASADAALVIARALRMRGLTELSTVYMQRARALYLLEHVPASHPQHLDQLQRRLEQLYGQRAPTVSMMAVVRGNVASSGGIGLYVELPQLWRWLSSPHANMLMAERERMPWLMHVAAMGAPPSASIDKIRENYFCGTMLLTSVPRPTYLGLAPAEEVEARAMAGDEVARYRIIFALRQGALVVLTFAAPERWWDLANPEFNTILQHVGLARRY